MYQRYIAYFHTLSSALAGLLLLLYFQMKIRTDYEYTGNFSLDSSIQLIVLFVVIGVGLHQFTKKKPHRTLIFFLLLLLALALGYLFLDSYYTCAQLGSMCDG